MALGYCIGSIYTKEVSVANRKKWLLLLGGGAIFLFIIIRAINAYGDPSPWSNQTSSLYTLFSFLSVTKYPPSLLYVLITVGLGLLFLAISENNPVHDPMPL